MGEWVMRAAAGVILLACLGLMAAERKPYGVPMLGLTKDTWRQTVVDRERGQYLGHPTTVLLEDGKTLLADLW